MEDLCKAFLAAEGNIAESLLFPSEGQVRPVGRQLCREGHIRHLAHRYRRRILIPQEKAQCPHQPPPAVHEKDMVGVPQVRPDFSDYAFVILCSGKNQDAVGGAHDVLRRGRNRNVKGRFQLSRYGQRHMLPQPGFPGIPCIETAGNPPDLKISGAGQSRASRADHSHSHQFNTPPPQRKPLSPPLSLYYIILSRGKQRNPRKKDRQSIPRPAGRKGPPAVPVHPRTVFRKTGHPALFRADFRPKKKPRRSGAFRGWIMLFCRSVLPCRPAAWHRGFPGVRSISSFPPR